VHAVGPLDLTVQEGDLLAIVGPSGCGKSTLLRALARTLDFTSGEVHQSGKVHLKENRLREGMAFVTQTPRLLPWRTLLQNACLGAEIKGKLEQGDLDRVRSSLARFRLTGFEDSLPGELSGGMAQRVALVRAIDSEPSLLFCDEPFSAVDFVSRFELNREFKKMCRGGITTVFVTHNIEEAIFLGDEILVLSGRPGRVVQRYEAKDLSILPNRHDPVECRKSAEFLRLFDDIWEDLKRGHSNY